MDKRKVLLEDKFLFPSFLPSLSVLALTPTGRRRRMMLQLHPRSKRLSRRKGKEEEKNKGEDERNNQMKRPAKEREGIQRMEERQEEEEGCTRKK